MAQQTTVTTVADLWLQPLPDAIGAEDKTNPSLSHKVWANAYIPVETYSFREPTIVEVNSFLAPDHAYGPNMFSNDPNDTDRLGKSVYRPNNPDVEHLQTEGDVVRDFVKNIAAPVQLAWNGNVNFLERSESGPPGPTQAAQTMDYYFSWQRGGISEAEKCMTGGELKKPYIIKRKQWKGEQAKGAVSLNLGKEMRGYAYIYNCPQVFVYDGRYLLILHFKATSRIDIKSENCAIDCCIIPRESIGVLRYALYRLIWRGWMRLVGENAANMAVTLDGWQRSFRYYSGIPRWKYGGQGNAEEQHRGGYLRNFNKNENAWYWATGEGNPVLYVDGSIVWDSWSTI